MSRCPACQEEILGDARFCGMCGFRLNPIPQETYRQRAKTTPPLVSDEPLPLTHAKKRGSAKLEVVDAEPAQAPKAPAVPPLPSAFGDQSPSPGQATQKQTPSPVRTPSAAMQAPTPAAQTATPPAPPRAAQPAAPQPERTKTDGKSRRWKRFPLKVEVSYESDHNFFTGFMQNIGEGGLFVATHMPAAIGDVIEVSFSVPGLERVCTAVCRVRWIREYNPTSPDTVPGMGLQFAQLESDVRAAIELFIENREPIFYDD